MQSAKIYPSPSIPDTVISDFQPYFEPFMWPEGVIF